MTKLPFVGTAVVIPIGKRMNILSWKCRIKKSVRRALQILYRIRGRLAGWTRYCPVCDNRVPGFRPLQEVNQPLIDQWRRGSFDLSKLEHYETFNIREFQCPASGCGDRERLFALFVRKELARSGDRRVRRMVDFAPSHNFLAFIRGQGCFDYRRADLFRIDVDDRVDIQNMHGYADASFDCFICSHILEHVLNDRKAMSELYRILKPEGWGIVMVPLMDNVEKTDEDPTVADPLERIRRFAQDDHVRFYARQDFLTRLEEAGFFVQQWRMEDFGREEFARCGISDNSTLYVVTKSPEAALPK